MAFLCFIHFFYFLDFFLLFKNRITGESRDLRDFLYFLLLGLNEPGPECRDLIFVQIGASRGRQFQRRRFVARRIISVRGKRAVVRHTNIFVGGYWGGFGFSARIGEEPARESSGEAPWNDAPGCASGLRWRSGSSGGP